MEVESIIRQGAAGPAAEAQCSRPGSYTQTPTGLGYVSPRHSTNKISVSFSKGLSSAVSLQNRQLRSIFPASKLPANSEAVKISPQTRQVHSRHDAQAKDLPQSLHTQPAGQQDPQTKKWSKSGEVLSRAETSQSYVAETPKGVSKRNRNTSMCKSSTRVQAPARTTEVLRIAAKPPTLQPTAQSTDVSRAAPKPPRHQHTMPAVLSNQPARSTNEAFINVQSGVPQPQSVVKANDKPIILPGSGVNNKASPRVSDPKCPNLVQKDTSNLRRSSRVSKSSRKYIDILLVVKNTL